MDEQGWRFDAAYTSDCGLDNSDVEMFKKDPTASLAREICQNSIDAVRNDEEPVRVEFKLFKINRCEVPSIDELTEEINACYKYKKDSPKEGKLLKLFKKTIESSEIVCLRISDFNTTGARGVTSKDTDTPFFSLTKGSGTSDKGGTCGGSKGMGKFASFVASTTHTVFYSTIADDGSCGYIGISKLRSRPFPDKDPRLLTMGTGYYGADDMNSPINEEIHLDKNFVREPGNYGTDIYIIGFNALKGWQNSIIAKILESFMVAIMNKKLEVSVDGTELNADTAKGIIESESFQTIPKRELKEILSQYELLKQDESVVVKELDVEGSTIIIHIKRYSHQEISDATRHCVMIRYPYMKITHITTGINLPFSALCIIEDNELNKKLREIENPQHTDWEIKRLDDFPDDKKLTKRLKKELEETVKNFISSVLHDGTEESTDIEGAGEFLPSQDEVNNNDTGMVAEAQTIVGPIKRVNTPNPKTVKSGEEGESYDFSIGDPDSDEKDRRGKKPTKTHVVPNPNPSPKPEPKEDDEIGIGEGNNPVLEKVALSGMRYINVSADKSKGKYDCVFTSNYDEDDCEFSIRICGSDTDKYPVKIIDAFMGGKKCNIQDGKIVHIKIEKGKKYKISYSVESNEVFASEVVLNAYR